MRLSLQAKVFLIFALVATLPLLAMSHLAVGQTQLAFREEVGRSNVDNAATVAAFVDVYVHSALAQVQAQALAPRLRDALAEDDRARTMLEVAEFQARASYRGRPLFDAVTLLDANGTVVAVHPAGAGAAGDDGGGSLAFLAVRDRSNATTLPPTPRGEVTVLPLAAPVLVSGRFAGALVADMSFEPLAESLGSFAGRPEERLVVADGLGHVLVAPDGVDRAAWARAEPVARGVRSLSGFTEFDLPGTSGARALAGHAPVPRLGWAVVTYEPVDTAYAGVARLTAVLAVLAADLLIAMLLASALVAHAFVKPVRRLTDAAEAVARGRLSTRLEPSSKDEMGDLARMFNLMAERVGSTVEESRRSEERYRSLVESANDLIFSVERDGTLGFVSGLSERFFGLPPSRLQGSPAAARVHPEDRSVFETATSRVLATGRPLSGVQYRIVHDDGTMRTVLTNLSPVMTTLDVPDRVLGVSRDVTLEREQERLRERSFDMARVVSEEAEPEPLLARGLAILLDAARLERGAAFIRRDGGFRLAAAHELPHVHDARWADALAPRADEPLQEVYERDAPQALAAHGVRRAFAVPLIERAQTLGLVVLLSDANAPLDADARQALGALASQLAVGLRRSEFESRLRDYATELETKVEERTALLLEKSQEMETFLYSVSHDLKAPLISIEGYAQGLEEDHADKLDDEARHYVERIRKNAELMESLIQDLLEFNRIGRVRETIGPVDTPDMLHDIAQRMRDAFAAEGGGIELGADLPTVEGERKRIAQLFTNLFHNALKYRVPERPPRVEVRARTEGDMVVFDVQDNGRGMPERVREKAFQLFQRFPSDAHPDPGGTGMGLAIVKRIAETHGGSVDYTTRPGEGTTFHVRLPRPAPPAALPRPGDAGGERR